MEQCVEYTNQSIPYTTILLCCYCAIGCFQIILSLVVPCACVRRCRYAVQVVFVVLIYCVRWYWSMHHSVMVCWLIIGRENSIVLYNNNTLFFAAVVIDDIDWTKLLWLLLLLLLLLLLVWICCWCWCCCCCYKKKDGKEKCLYIYLCSDQISCKV